MSEILKNDVDPIETQDWLQSLDSLIREEGVERAQYIIEQVIGQARTNGVALPTGVNSSSINQITINVTLGEGVTKTISDVKISYINNVNNYKASQVNNKTTVNVTVFGTEENIANITADDINVYIDMTNAKPGLVEFPLYVEQPKGGLVKYSLSESTYTLNILGETDSTETDNGGNANNG